MEAGAKRVRRKKAVIKSPHSPHSARNHGNTNSIRQTGGGGGCAATTGQVNVCFCVALFWGHGMKGRINEGKEAVTGRRNE